MSNDLCYRRIDIELFLVGLTLGFGGGIIFNLILLVITLLGGYSLKIIIPFGLITGLIFTLLIISFGLAGSLGCGIGSGLTTLIFVTLSVGLKQGLIAGGMVCSATCLIFFFIMAILIIKDIGSDIWRRYR